MKYIGKYASDAEICLDFVRGNLTIDYANDSEGSDSVEHIVISIAKTLKHSIILLLLIFFVGIGTILILLIFPLSYIDSPRIKKFHHANLFPRLYAFYVEHTSGICEVKHEGTLKDNILSVYLPSNLRIDYFLEGDYKKQVEKVELKRNFIKQIFDGSEWLQQQGWHLVFTFKEPPQDGSCRVQYV